MEFYGSLQLIIGIVVTMILVFFLIRKISHILFALIQIILLLFLGFIAYRFLSSQENMERLQNSIDNKDILQIKDQIVDVTKDSYQEIQNGAFSARKKIPSEDTLKEEITEEVMEEVDENFEDDSVFSED